MVVRIAMYVHFEKSHSNPFEVSCDFFGSPLFGRFYVYSYPNLCNHHWHMHNNIATVENSIRVELELSPMLALHPTESKVTLICLCTPNATLDEGLSIRTTWTKDETLLLFNDTRHTITRRSFMRPNTSDVEQYETRLVMHSVKPADRGAYTCSATVVSHSTQQALTNRYTNQVNISVVGKCSFMPQNVRLLQERLLAPTPSIMGAMATDCG